MKAAIILIEMIFLHFFADYHLQGILSCMKKRDWWKQELTKSEYVSGKYKKDYLQALYAHSFEWSFIVQLPLLVRLYNLNFSITATITYIVLFLINTLWHFIVDNEKANEHTINLNQDQQLHSIQIFITFIAWTIIVGW